MNLKAYFISISFGALMGCSMFSGRDISGIETFNKALRRVNAGDTIFLSPGTFKNWEASIGKSGTEDKPIVISGSKNSLTVFSDTIKGNPFFRLQGQHIVLTNIKFSNTTFRDPIIVLDSCSHSSISNCTFIDNTAMKQYNHMVSISGNGSRNKIEKCTFDNIANGQLLSVRIGETYPTKTLISQNTFRNIPPNKYGNGAESIQVGQDQVVNGLAEPGVIVEQNNFIHCNGESEIISNKASGNIYRNNRFEDCEGAIVMRGGHKCEIYGNEFQGGRMGVRLNGTRHHVHNNVINDTEVGISLQYGSGIEHEPAFYTAVSHCVIEENNISSPRLCGIKIGGNKGNTRPVSNPKKQALLGKVYRQIYPPVNNKILSNTITAETGKHIFIDGAPDNILENNILKKP